MRIPFTSTVATSELTEVPIPGVCEDRRWIAPRRPLDSTRENRRQEEFNNRGAQVRRRVDRRSVGWLCRRGGRRLRVCWPAGAGGRDGGGSGYWRAGRTGVCGRTGRGARPERLWG